MRRFATAFLLLAFCSAVGWADDGGRLVHTRQREFKIPFQVADGDDAAAIKEIQLYVARDRGPWELYTSIEPARQPNERFFVFRTDSDGEYWFAVRTVDKSGQAVPARVTDLKPELKVIIDATQPKISLQALPAAGDRVGIEWKIDEPYVDFRSLQIEYRVGEQGQWKPVPGVAPRIAGRVSWRVTEPGTVFVRAQVQDQAGNLGIAHTEISRAQIGAGSTDRATPSFTTGPSMEFSDTKSDPPAQGTTDPDAPSRFPSFPTFDTPNSGPSMPSPASESFGPTGDHPSSHSGLGHGPSFPSPTSSDTSPPMGRGMAEPTTAAAASPADTPSRKPANRSIVRHRAIKIDYAVEDVGPSGVGAVQLWVTTDGGRTWKLYGEDVDRRPPFEVDLSRILGNRDGVVGFKLVARSGVGLGEDPPTAGTTPDVWVELDTTPPLVQIKSVTPGQGPTSGSIIIQWLAEDSNLGARPVSLYYGNNGNWMPIATQIPNTGSYTWQLPLGQVPPQIRIGINVMDEAGNRTFVQSEEITIDLSRPKARVTGVMPIEGAARR